MEFSVKTSEILPKLELAIGAVERKSTIPILSNVLIEANEGAVHIAATDLEISIRALCPAKVKEEGAATVPAKKLLDLIRLLPEGEVRFKSLENHWVRITSDRKTYKLVGMSKDNFPALPDFPSGESVSFSPEVFRETVRKVSFAISEEEWRYMLNGALVSVNGSVGMVATDGHRLALVGEMEGKLVIVPKNALHLVAQAVKKHETPISYSAGERNVFFKSADWLIVSRRLEGQFPNYQAVLPKESTIQATVNREELKAALGRVGQMADQRGRAVKFLLSEEGLQLSAASPEYGEAAEIIPADGVAGKMEIAFNCNYVLDFLAHATSERIAMRFKDASSAGDFLPLGENNYRYIVMSMRV